MTAVGRISVTTREVSNVTGLPKVLSFKADRIIIVEPCIFEVPNGPDEAPTVIEGSCLTVDVTAGHIVEAICRDPATAVEQRLEWALGKGTDSCPQKD